MITVIQKLYFIHPAMVKNIMFWIKLKISNDSFLKNSNYQFYFVSPSLLLKKVY